MSCAECVFANKSGNEEFVYCTYWQRECNQSNMVTENFVKEVMFSKTFLQKVALGWGFPHQHYQLPTHWVHKGTANESLMWSEQICVHKEEKCDNFEAV